MGKPLATLYFWQADDAQRHRQQGHVLAESAQHVRTQLLLQGLRPTLVKRSAARRKKLPQKQLATHARQLATMLHAGVPLLQACQMCADNSPPQLAAALHHIQTLVAAGQPLHSAMQQHPLIYPKLFCQMVAAGEQSGTLDTLLLRQAHDLEQASALRGQCQSALIYPAIVLLIAIGVVATMLLWVVPAFTHMFASLGAELPTATRWLMQLSQTVQHSGLAILGTGAAVIAITVYGVQQSPKLQGLWHRGLYRSPWLGLVVQHHAAAHWARTLSTLLAAGLPLLDALHTVANTAGNQVVQQASLQVRAQLLTGQAMTTALQATQAYPTLLVQMVAIGEASGTLDSMLLKAADIYHTETQTLLKGLTTVLEPVLMVLLGAVIGGLVLALYLPVFSLGQAL